MIGKHRERNVTDIKYKSLKSELQWTIRNVLDFL
jgi:hypothetical protein